MNICYYCYFCNNLKDNSNDNDVMDEEPVSTGKISLINF